MSSLKWFEFRQNNPGGSFKGPALKVFVQADAEDVACVLAQRHGVYFDGCASGTDCNCCGDRWSRPYESLDAEPVLSDEYYTPDYARRCGLRALYVYADGKTREVQP